MKVLFVALLISFLCLLGVLLFKASKEGRTSIYFLLEALFLAKSKACELLEIKPIVVSVFVKKTLLCI